MRSHSRHLPDWVRARIELDLAHNAIRHERTMCAYREVQSALTSRGLSFLVLKGFTHFPFFCDDLRARPQYDLDLYCPPSDIEAAYQAILALGYEPFREKTGTPLDHLSRATDTHSGMLAPSRDCAVRRPMRAPGRRRATAQSKVSNRPSTLRPCSRAHS